MSGYLGTKAVTLSTTSATVGGDSTVGGDLTVDTNTLYVDSTNNRVGIGNAAPTQALDVTGDIVTSGGVYLGGTGSSNHLDDYEEGSWAPSFYDGFTSVSFSIQKGRYTKMGRFVACEFYILFDGTGLGSQIQIQGLPFVIANGDSFVQGGGLSTYQSVTGDTVQFYGSNSATRFSGYYNGSSAFSSSSALSGKYIIGTFQYITA